MRQIIKKYIIYNIICPVKGVWLSCIVLGLLLFSCKRLVLVNPPVDQVTTPIVFSNAATATSAQLYIYYLMASSASYNLSLNSGLLADELKNYATSGTPLLLYRNAMNPIDIDPSTGSWQAAYNYIYRANAIVEGLRNYDGISAAIKQQLTGESRFIRAFWHFYLTNCYGDVPIVTTTDYTVNNSIRRSPISLVYEQIIADLKDASILLSSDYLDATDTAMADNRLRPTRWAAKALLARAYLYNHQYDSAEAAASEVISNNALFDLPALNNVFLTTSREAIWQIGLTIPNSSNTKEGNNFILIGAPGTGANPATISTQLLNSFEAGDNRKTSWIDSISVPTVYYFPYKYKVKTSADPSSPTEYTMVLRLAEQYLIRAEARALKNAPDIPGAQADLNAVRTRAGLPNTTAVTATDLQDAILHERQVELFTEWGHRWFDLIRTGNANAVMSMVTPLKGGTWDPSGYQQLFPIPQSEINSDYNLTQNPGYH